MVGCPRFGGHFMSLPISEVVFAAIVAAVRRYPDRWSIEAQAIAIALATSGQVRPNEVEALLDYAENVAAAMRVVRHLRRTSP